MSDDRKYYVQKEVLESGVKIVFPVIEGMDNTKVSEDWMAYRNAKIAELYEKYRDLDVHQDEILEGFNILHDHTGVKRRKNIPASENLIRLLKKNGGMYFINQAVDIYNLISLETKLALGAHDLDHTEGNVTLRFTDGTEKFVPLGQSEPVPVAPHEYSYCDDANEVLCRLEIRQVNKTAVHENTARAFYIVQGNEYTSYDDLMDAALKIIDTTVKYCGGKGRIVVPEAV